MFSCYCCSAAKLCLFCNPMDCSLPRSSVHRIALQEYWRGLPFPSPGDLPTPGIEPESPAWQADSLPTELSGKPLMSFKSLYLGVMLKQRRTLWSLSLMPSAFLLSMEKLWPKSKFNQRNGNRQKQRKTGKGDHIKIV